MKTIPRLAAVGASIALAAAGFLAVGTAGAETVDISTPLVTPPSGLTLHMADGSETELPAPEGSNFIGSFDDATGELTGDVTITPGSFPITNPLPVDVFFHFESGGPITDGMIDEDGNVSFTDTQTLYLDRAGDLLDFGDDCAFGPIEIAYEGTYDDATNLIDVMSAEIDVPAVTGTCNGQASLIGGLLAGATVSAHLQFELAVGDIPEPVEPVEPVETTTTTTTVAPAQPARPAAPAAPATPVAASPSYTG